MTNTQLTEKRARLRKAAQDYQSTLSWYQENLDSPNAEQDCDEASAAFKREIGYREMDIIADLLDEIDELQERRKPLQDKDLQGVIDALEHPAGINAAGKQVVRHALVELQERRKADSEPVATLDVQSGRPYGNKFALVFSSAAHKLPDDVYFLYRHAQPAPVVPDSYVMVPMRLTAENGAKGALSGEFSETKFVNCPECFGDDECETCDGSGRIEITVPVTWTTIKEIWAKGVEHFSAIPREVKGE
ncbi:TPA: hypothetical protein ACYU6M_004412 [Klebsiella pneumoniae]